jgi:DNA polymerase IV
MPLTTLFLDLNAYFASVEQQVQPALRGKPIAVAPIIGDSGCCIAVSYEAKAFGIKTGTRVGEARALCPSITIVDARPRLYVLMHHRVLAAVDTCMPVHQVHSIDELSCRLDATQRTPQRARGLALDIKGAIRRRCGPMMRCSIGIAPNRVLAKLGTDMHKPDGLVILTDGDLPGAIAHLPANTLTGIGPRLMKRLEIAGVRTIGDLAARPEHDLEGFWGGVVGRHWWHWLRGHELREKKTRKRSIGHQHVLGPDTRHSEAARAVAFRLLLKAGARLRHDGYAARTLTLGVSFKGDSKPVSSWGAASWSVSATLGDGCDDSPTMLDALGVLWTKVPDGIPMMVGVTLHELVPRTSRSLPLFREERRRADLSRAMDAVNAKFGANTLYTANIQEARSAGSGGIAFTYVPDLSVTDSVSDRMRGRTKRMTDAELEELIERSLTIS